MMSYDQGNPVTSSDLLLVMPRTYVESRDWQKAVTLILSLLVRDPGAHEAGRGGGGGRVGFISLKWPGGGHHSSMDYGKRSADQG